MEEVFKNIFDDVDIKIGVFRIEDTKLKVLYNHNLMDDIKEISIENYKKRFQNKAAIVEFFENKKKMKIDSKGMTILNFIKDGTFYEFSIDSSSEIEYILSVISYKVRTPLTNIVGILPLLEDFSEDKMLKKYIRIIKESCIEIISLANDIIDILKIKQNKIVVEKEKTSVTNLVHDMVATVESIIGTVFNKKYNISYNISPIVPKYIYVDKSKVKQILVNLFSTSINLTSIGQVYLDVCVDEQNYKKINNECILHFKIKNNGSGINKEYAEFIKKVLDDTDTSNISDNKMTDFYIYIAKKISDLLGTKIRFQWVPDIGTIFYFTVTCQTDPKISLDI